MSQRQRTLIIAEAGVNHNGSLELAKQLIDAAAAAGVDYVKFQTFKTEKLVSKAAAKADYQVANTGDAVETQFEMIKKLEIDADTHRLLIDYCSEKGIQFFSTAFDLDSIDLLEELGLDLYKVPSGEMTNLPYLRAIAAKGKPVILSTGMCTLSDIEAALNVMLAAGQDRERITILHCNTEYPTPMEDVNLRAMQTIGTAFGVRVGYSDHTLGIEVPIAAVAMGAVCIEKHFTLDRTMEGPDHRASLEPNELKAMVSAIRNIEVALGSTQKLPSSSERKNIPIARKSIFVSKDLPKGHVLTEADLSMMRPGDGISPMRMEELIGRSLSRPLAAATKIALGDYQ
ncbi:N-acetylneuraminate synthase [Lewinella sp. 4G2]|uniref:N-acetylneuraminate synthase n=1 Tax=Lewinella sp. 4G2 TaxID=1803372 RepID=UPI0007B4F2FD|nr:N-acetylneuraminate synthase [Lewinella sp. 4G2]OAV44315.1 N-acetylneuraminate synthase [Lewinella sp. 4G2]